MVPLMIHTMFLWGNGSIKGTQHDETITNNQFTNNLKQHVIKLVILQGFIEIVISM